MAKVYVLLAHGFETVEALTPVDVLRRCGVECVTVAVGDALEVQSSHGVTVLADRMMKDGGLDDGGALVLPGGFPGYRNLADSAEVGDWLRQYEASGRLIAAICGAPSVLSANGILSGSALTCHTSVRDRMTHYRLIPEGVVADGRLITAAGAGWSLEFALHIAERLCGAEAVRAVRRKMEI